MKGRAVPHCGASKEAPSHEFCDGLVYNSSEDSITHGMAIAAAVTPTSTDAVVALIGVNDGFST